MASWLTVGFSMVECEGKCQVWRCLQMLHFEKRIAENVICTGRIAEKVGSEQKT